MEAVIGIFLFQMLFIVIFGMHDTTQPADMIVVFGNTVNMDGSLSPRLKARLDKSFILYTNESAPLIFVSGGTGKERQDEAIIMKQYLVTLGVPEERIITDSEGINTMATVRNAKQFMDKHGLHKVLGVTQYFHIARMTYAFKKVGFTDVGHAHADFSELRDVYSLPREVMAFWEYVIYK